MCLTLPTSIFVNWAYTETIYDGGGEAPLANLLEDPEHDAKATSLGWPDDPQSADLIAFSPVLLLLDRSDSPPHGIVRIKSSGFCPER